VAAATVGIRAIVNRITVEPVTMRSDRELKKAVEAALSTDPATEAYQVSVSVEEGTVTLTGKVDSYAERELSETVVKDVRGVKAVENNVLVEYEVERTDPQIEAEIKARLENDIRVDGYMVNVEVNNGHVELSGTAGSLQEKNQAMDDAWVAGVNSVEGDDIEIKWWARDEMRRVREYVSRTDNQIKQAVKDALTYDARVASFKIDVSVEDGTVTLSGKVDNLAAKQAAEEDARNTLGVWRVKNHIKVRPEIPENEQMEDRVSNALVENPYTERYEIVVDAREGWVYLSGDVQTSFEKNEAERIVEGVQGVVGVVNNLNFEYQWNWKPDREIRADVRDQLEWSPFVDEDDVAVTVDDGVVTLTGTVDSWSEREDAEKNAYQGGAKDVQNDLDVQYDYYGPYSPDYYGSPAFQGPEYYGPEYEPQD
jgi:osmotically-inducible protein OsmY